MAVVPLVWLFVWYVAWFAYDDCSGALRQVGGLDPQLHASLTGDCDAAEARHWLIGATGFLLVLAVEWLLWRLIRAGRHQADDRPY
jgi:hypothetical protein